MGFKKYTSAERAILTTLLYSDIFSFPLTKDELWRLLISKEKISRNTFEEDLHKLKKHIVFEKGYYCLPGREETIAHRIKNIPEIERKMRIARSVAKKLSSIPSILFIGISGGLAVGSVSKKDDIDFVFIVKRNTLFSSRLLILGVLEKLGVRRARAQKNTADTICANLLFDETALNWFGTSRNVYTAREITQLRPLFVRGNIYQYFLNANKWIGEFLPNTKFLIINSKSGSHPGKQETSASRIIRFGTNPSTLSSKPKGQNEDLTTNVLYTLLLNSFSETLARLIQLSLIRRHQTKEIVTKHVLAFHPMDYRAKTLKQLRLKMRQIGLLTNF